MVEGEQPAFAPTKAAELALVSQYVEIGDGVGDPCYAGGFGLIALDQGAHLRQLAQVEESEAPPCIRCRGKTPSILGAFQRAASSKRVTVKGTVSLRSPGQAALRTGAACRTDTASKAVFRALERCSSPALTPSATMTSGTMPMNANTARR